MGVSAQNCKMFKNLGGGPNIPIEDILSDFDIMVGTPQKILRCWRSRGGHRTFPLRVSELGGDNAHNSKMFLNLGLTLHIPILRKQERKSFPVRDRY